MSANDAAKSILAGLRAFLSPHGFRRKEPTFTAERGDLFLLVNLQRSTSSTKDVLILTLNLGVYSVLLADRAREEGQFAPPSSIWACHWNRRIGGLMPGNSDQWWRLARDGDAALVEKELLEGLERYGLPALEGVASTARLRALWETGASPGLTDKQRQDYLALLD